MMPHLEELEGFRVKKKESVEILTPGAMKAFSGVLDREWLPFSRFRPLPPLLHQRDWRTLNMASTDIYARCNFTRSGHPNIRFSVIIKVPKAKLEELRQPPANRDQTDNQLLGSLGGKVITIVYPDPGATFALGCERYPEGAIPTEVKERPEGTNIDELTFWSI